MSKYETIPPINRHCISGALRYLCIFKFILIHPVLPYYLWSWIEESLNKFLKNFSELNCPQNFGHRFKIFLCATLNYLSKGGDFLWDNLYSILHCAYVLLPKSQIINQINDSCRLFDTNFISMMFWSFFLTSCLVRIPFSVFFFILNKWEIYFKNICTLHVPTKYGEHHLTLKIYGTNQIFDIRNIWVLM